MAGRRGRAIDKKNVRLGEGEGRRGEKDLQGKRKRVQTAWWCDEWHVSGVPLFHLSIPPSLPSSCTLFFPLFFLRSRPYFMVSFPLSSLLFIISPFFSQSFFISSFFFFPSFSTFLSVIFILLSPISSFFSSPFASPNLWNCFTSNVICASFPSFPKRFQPVCIPAFRILTFCHEPPHVFPRHVTYPGASLAHFATASLSTFSNWEAHATYHLLELFKSSSASLSSFILQVKPFVCLDETRKCQYVMCWRWVSYSFHFLLLSFVSLDLTFFLFLFCLSSPFTSFLSILKSSFLHFL